ncbi:hypothetical protein [Collinsella tanakaei]|uniref:hypothetical protein n=1 Tax=Collinsella tanakaei TaxID=626935 RepID=UPI0025A3D8AA|nr:hypothetical protein [Collinsella tanakaei]MDM8302023.1 hypothetical protein [Collinsella tanakaei]
MGGKRSSSKPKIQWAVALGAAGAWFGQHCGAGFASGVQEITYFVNAGWLSLFTTLVPMLIIGIAFYYLGEYAREIHASSYKDVALTLYSSNRTIGKVMLFVYDLIIMASVLVMSSSTLAGAGSLLNETLGIDYTLATVLFMFVVAGISMFGAQFLAKLNLPMSIVLVGGLVVIDVALIGGNWDNLSGIIASRETFGAEPGSIVMNVISYTLTQTGFAGAYMAIAGQLTSKTETRTMAIAGIVINTGVLLLVSLAVLSGMPGIADEDLPILIMIRDMFGSGSILFAFYSLSQFLAYVSTADVVAATSRFGSLVNRNGCFNQVVVDAIIALVLLTCSILLAQFGIRALVDVAYRGLGMLRGPVYLEGGLIFAPIRLRQLRRARVEAHEA